MKKMFELNKKGMVLVIIVLLSCAVATFKISEKETNAEINHVQIEVGKKVNLEKEMEVKDTFLVKKSIDDSKVNYEKIGDYVAKVRAEPVMGKIKTHDVKVKIVDTIEPKITIDEEKSKEVEFGSEVNVKEYFKLEDNYETKEILNRLVTVDSVKTDQLGETESKIVATDTSGNLAEIVINFNIVDTQAPTINIEENTTIEHGSKFSTISDLTIEDNVDELTTNDVKVELNNEKVSDSNYIDTKKSGDYILKYSVKDKSGNEAVKERKVTVKAYVPPVVTQPAKNSSAGSTRNSGGGSNYSAGGGASTGGSKVSSTSNNSGGYALNISTSGGSYWWSGSTTLCAHNPGAGSNFAFLGVGSKICIDGTGYEIVKSYKAYGSINAGYDVTQEQSLTRVDTGEYVGDEYMFRNYSMQTCVGDNKTNYIKILRKIDGGQPARNSSISVSEPQ